MTKVSAHHLVWMDLEMTGLDLKTNRILEIATVVTDYNLDILAEGPIIAIHQSEAELSKMDAWNTKHHTRSGLVERVRLSTITEKMAEAETLNFLKAWVPAGKSPLCGNSICQDRRFLAEYMPELEQYFHYRNLDVSTLKELAKYWKPNIVKLFKKKSAHLAMADIKESINELKHYREMFLALE